MNDYLIRGRLAEVDPAVAELIQHEQARQFGKLMMIPSSSSAPRAVLEAVGSVFHNLYAEGYPHPDMRALSEAELLDYDAQLTYFRRYADRRYYKGADYVNILEALAQRRTAEAFCPPGMALGDLFVNVQPLSGAPANTAIYEALVNEGDVVMGLDLMHGGHLTHGSPVNRSGRHHKIVSYRVNEKTERIDYDEIMALAVEHKPKMIIAGYTSYPLAPDFRKFRAIADACGAFLMADISHTAGLAAAGLYPNPIGIADVTSFTTHKSLIGPRAAVIVSTRADLADRIDRAVFPGEQGGPHINAIAGIAVAMKLAQQPVFKRLQQQIVANAKALADGFAANGVRVAHGGTDTHMVLIDTKSCAGTKDNPLMGDAAARILDVAGIVANRNTLPGDKSPLRPSGVRFGTPWVTQRGLVEADMGEIAEVAARILKSARPFTLSNSRTTSFRAKVDFDALIDGARRIGALAQKAGTDAQAPSERFPHDWTAVRVENASGGLVAFEVTGEDARNFLHLALTCNVLDLPDESAIGGWALERDGKPLSPVVVARDDNRMYVAAPVDKAERLALWLRALSDGYVIFDNADAAAKLPGPVAVKEAPYQRVDAALLPTSMDAKSADASKPYYVGRAKAPAAAADALARATASVAGEGGALKRTALNDTHRKLGAKMVPFGGWDMPVWYTSVSEEHLAVRNAAGLFDVTHMGVIDCRGPNAQAFLDAATSNDVTDVKVGESQYGYLFDPAADVIDDIMIYRVEAERYLVVINASNNDKDIAWLRALNDGSADLGGLRLPACELRDLRDPSSGDDQRVDVALQGPAALPTLQAMLIDDGHPQQAEALARLPKTGVMPAALAGCDVFISRTGYTGESIAYEIFVHPDKSVGLWNAILAAGAAHGVKPAGLAARDSLRTEAGLPLYGHELAGPLNLGPQHIGFGGYVKAYKPFFVGKGAYFAKAAKPALKLSRFRMNEKGVRVPKLGDPALDNRGRVVGTVLSCAADTEGFLLGMVMLDSTLQAREGMPIRVMALPERRPAPLTNLAALGSRALVPDEATVLSRFPKKVK